MGYRGKTAEQGRARDLRAEGWTYTEIMAELGVAKSSVSLWCRDVVVDEAVLALRRRGRYLRGNQGARQRGPNRLQRAKQDEVDELMAAGRERMGVLSEDAFLAAGVALYAGEGAKRDGRVCFTNSDPRMIEFFVRWLRHFWELDESRFRMRLYLHEGLDLDEANTFWSRLTAIPMTQFTAPYRAQADPTIRTAKHPMGCAAVIYGCSRTHRAVMGLVHALLICKVPSGVAQSAERLTVNQ